MGFEGHSYQGYQPPLSYVLLAPVYAILPDDMLVKLYSLRWVMVGLSLLTVWMTYRMSHELFPQWRTFPYLACLLLAVLPERTASISRVNNDVLLEVIATALVWVCVRITLRGLSVRRSQWLGLLMGLGILTKMSMAGLMVMVLFVFWMNRRRPGWYRGTLWTSGITAVLITPFIARNLWLYGDWTGFSSFLAIRGYYESTLNLATLISSVMDLFRHFWVIWWKSASPGTNSLLNGVWILLAVLCGFSLVGSMKYLRRHRNEQQRVQVFLMFALAIIGYAVSALIIYLTGIEPVIQGRFLLPVIAPIVILFSWGLWNNPHGETVLLATCGILVVLDALSLFGNLMPYFYYWSAFVENGVPMPYTPLSVPEAWAVFYPRFLDDKPAWLQPLLIWMLPVYAGAVAFVAVALKHSRTRLWGAR